MHSFQSRIFDQNLALPVGRSDEIARVVAALSDTTDSSPTVVALIAKGGVGKSRILHGVERAMAEKEAPVQFDELIDWSFYSQGSTNRNVWSEPFFDAAFEQLGVPKATYQKLPPAARGELLYEAVRERNILICLDGIEPLQYGAGPLQGAFKDPGLAAFLGSALSDPKFKSRVVITSREPLTSFTGSPALTTIGVEKLSVEAVGDVLNNLGLASATNQDQILHDLFAGHGLALSLAAHWIRERRGGDIGAFLNGYTHNSEIKAAIDSSQPGASYGYLMIDHALTQGLTPHQTQLLSLVGLFDREIEQAAIVKLMQELYQVQENDVAAALNGLRSLGLIYPEHTARPGVIDTQPLVREFMGPRFQGTDFEGWKKACTIMGEYFSDRFPTTPTRDTSAAEFVDGYQAVRFFTAARDSDAAVGVLKRIWNMGDSTANFLGTREHGHYGLELTALGCFFTGDAWEFHDWVADADKALILGEAGIRLRNVGRIQDSLKVFEAAQRLVDEGKAKKSKEFCQALCGLVDVYLASGRSKEAAVVVTRAVVLADELDSPSHRILSRSRKAEVLLHGFWSTEDRAGIAEAAELVEEATQIAKDTNSERFLESQTLFAMAQAAVAGGTQDVFLEQLTAMEAVRAEGSISLLGRAIRPLSRGVVLLSRKEVTAANMHLTNARMLLRQSGYADYYAVGLLALAAARQGDGAYESAKQIRGQAAALKNDAKLYGVFPVW